VALTLRTPTEAAVFEQEQRRQRQTERRETNSGKSTGKILKKAGMRNLRKGQESELEKSTGANSELFKSTRSKKQETVIEILAQQKQSPANDGEL